MEKTTTFEDSFAEEIWASTYKDHSDKDINDTLRRIAKAIANVESVDMKPKWEEEFYDMLTGFKVMVGGRIMANAGTEWSGTTLMNCFVGPREKKDVDSLSSILSHLGSQAKTLKSEGGWGENFSYLRPRGGFIHGIGVESPGAVKYMELFDKSSEIITSGSGKKSTEKKAKGKIRKGAQMGVLDIWHPDIVEFITAKQQPGRLTKFNMSVNVSESFMERINNIQSSESLLNDAVSTTYSESAIQQLKDRIESLDRWDLIFPETTFEKYKEEWDGDIKLWKSKGYPVKVYNTVSVKWLWNLVMESTYNRAEPGVLFLDRANKFNPFSYGETIFATNPCVSGDTIVSTDKGEIRMDDLVERYKNGEKFKAFTYNTDTKIVELEDIVFADKTRDNANVISLEMEDGTILKLTPDHKVYTENRGYVKASELTEDDILIEMPQGFINTLERGNDESLEQNN
jgi:ribonucleoside-diphosphate reductase alpha chain